jgi:hypothetical protein
MLPYLPPLLIHLAGKYNLVPSNTSNFGREVASNLGRDVEL